MSREPRVGHPAGAPLFPKSTETMREPCERVSLGRGFSVSDAKRSWLVRRKCFFSAIAIAAGFSIEAFSQMSDERAKAQEFSASAGDRPLRALRNEMLRWYDHWLKGVDSGLAREPAVTYWVMGSNEWRTADDWPLPETQWTKLYLNSWERLTPQPFLTHSLDDNLPPDAFVQMPPTQTNTIAKLRYLSEPLAHDLLVAGPIVLNLWASIDQDDTNWIVVLKDIGPDVSVRTAREGERAVPDDLPERELTRGWLKASLRALDPDRTLPWKPWHRLTREARAPVVPGEIIEYLIEIHATANLFKGGHRICLEITSLDLPTGVSGTTNVEYIPYHIASSRTTLHKVYHDAPRPSHLLLPVIPPNDSSANNRYALGLGRGWIV